MKKLNGSLRRAARIVIGSVISLALWQFISSGSVLTRSQSSVAPNQREVAQLSDAFMASLQTVGNVRNVNPELLHPLFVEGLPCPLIQFVEPNICRTLSPEERRDYALATLNVIWLVYEYQLSQPVPLWLQADPSLDDPLELFPIEVRPVMEKLAGRSNTIEAFRKLHADTKEAEARLLVKHSQMTESGKSNFAKNSAKISDVLRRKGLDFEDLVPDGEIAEGAFRYTRPPFVFVVARDRGILKVIYFSFMTD